MRSLLKKNFRKSGKNILNFAENNKKTAENFPPLFIFEIFSGKLYKIALKYVMINYQYLSEGEIFPWLNRQFSKARPSAVLTKKRSLNISIK
jgi:hypothetical protein